MKVSKDKYGTNMYELFVDTYQLILKNSETFNGLLCCISNTTYVGLLQNVYNWMRAVSVNVFQHKDKLLIRDDIKHLYV